MFEVGQKVMTMNRYGYGLIGTIIEIKEKPGDVVVRFKFDPVPPMTGKKTEEGKEDEHV
jgi:hypothetical protein